MRGSAVPTIVWSSASRNRARPTPIVARILPFLVRSPDIGVLLRHCFECVVEVGKRRMQACPLVRGQPRDDACDTLLHVFAVAVELATAARRQLDKDDPPVARALQ